MDAFIDSWRRELPELDQPVLDFVKRAARLGQLLEEALVECLAPWSLSKADYSVLSILRVAGAPYEMRPTDLRNRLLLTSGGVSNIVNRLERLNLVERVPDPADGRSSWVRLTSGGVGTAEETIRAWAAVQEQLLSGLPAPLAQQGSDTLRAVLLVLGDREPAAPASRQPA
ncbi:MAG: MarR family winged helix-turn-helix transcriptional regulator [Trebonia sp.]